MVCSLSSFPGGASWPYQQSLSHENESQLLFYSTALFGQTKCLSLRSTSSVFFYGWYITIESEYQLYDDAFLKL